ncbi:kynurenine/alpha-aminoadipate aminotransferase, mitochondrial-like isoform X2 [Phymastichus coffea]|nr:kynurenine/alpha-aminoadipate aminotransferase, mitochondrial-like isoform X2 [Phymastichus coffea]
MRNPDALFFAGGMPNAQMFPFKAISVTYDDGTSHALSEAELLSALQYGPTQGYLPLIRKWREFQERHHSPGYADWDVHFSTGSMDGCCKIIELLLEEGEPMMAQSPTYTGVLGAVLPISSDLVAIEMDEQGALPQAIAAACEDRLRRGGRAPKLLYVNPTGANPDGTCYSYERKQQIYRLAQRYDFLILEDDAYYFLHFLDQQPKSFLSLDVDGRVLRLDSFSKIMSSGLRLGVVTAPRPLLDKMTLHMQVSTLHPSALSQVLVHKLLTGWSEQQLDQHLARVRRFYRDKRDAMLRAVEKHFAGIAEWSVPKAGMFVWLKITVLDDTYDLVVNKCIPQGVFALPGHAFYPDSSKPCPYIRLCYSQADERDVDEGLAKIAAITRAAAAEKGAKVNGALAENPANAARGDP